MENDISLSYDIIHVIIFLSHKCEEAEGALHKCILLLVIKVI